MTTQNHSVVIVGGGSAGISVAARLKLAIPNLDIAIIEPSDKHYYQPLWTLVGAGIFDKEVTERDEAEFIPEGVTWIREKATSFDPDNNAVELESGTVLNYEQLVVTAGIQINWGDIKGLEGALGNDGVASNYSYAHVSKTWDFLRSFQGGNAIFTFPATPIKCAGAPQKIMYLAEEAFRRQGVREKSKVIFASATAGIFGIPHYKVALEKVIADRKIDTEYDRNLIELRTSSKEAVFASTTGEDEIVLKYDFIHVTPPQSAPDFIRKSPLADEGGWVDVDKHTMQHNKFSNVFSLGDCSSLPCSKTGAAIRKQAPLCTENILAFRADKPLTGKYDGYASCPLVTGYGRVMLAEFGYDGVIMETFPVNQAKERFSMYVLKAHMLPDLYWHGMLRGRM